MFKKYFFFLITTLFFPLLFLNTLCFANSQEDKLQHPFFLSVSGSGGASLNEDFSYLINPALLAFHQRKKIGLSYSFKNESQTGVLSLVDNRVKLPVALTYQRWWSDSVTKAGKNKLFLSSGLKLSNFFSLGFNIERKIEKTTESLFFGNASIGSFLKLSPQFGMALILDKVLKEEDQNLKLLTVSGSYLWKNFFSIQTDLTRSAQKNWTVKGGLESLFHPLFSFQLGGIAFMKELNLKEMESYLFSGGLSFHSPKFSFQYGLQTDSKNYQHSLTCLIKI